MLYWLCTTLQCLAKPFLPYVETRHGTDPGQVTGTGHRNGCPVPGDLGSGQNGYDGYLARHHFGGKSSSFVVKTCWNLTKLEESLDSFRSLGNICLSHTVQMSRLGWWKNYKPNLKLQSEYYHQELCSLPHLNNTKSCLLKHLFFQNCCHNSREFWAQK